MGEERGKKGIEKEWKGGGYAGKPLVTKEKQGKRMKPNPLFVVGHLLKKRGKKN